MTFTLKDYNTLKSSFHQTLDILDRRDKKTDSERKKQIDFLKDVIAILDNNIQQVSRPTTRHTNKKENEQRNKAILIETAEAKLTLYGAMAFIVSSINEKLGYGQGSLLRDRLYGDDMGISADNTPTSLQYNKMYQQLNQSLQLLFNDNKASNGIKTQSPLATTEVRTLVHWMRESYQHEQQFFIDALPGKASLSKTEAAKKIVEYSVVPGESAPLSFDIKPFTLNTLELPEWEILKSELQDLINGELARKNTPRIDELKTTERVNQLNFLATISDLLQSNNKINPTEKSAVLLGSMHIIREQISKEYNKGLLNSEMTNSYIHKNLSKILKFDRQYPDRVDPLVNMAQTFMIHLSIEKTAEQTQKIHNTHALESLPQEFLIDLLKLSQKILYTARTHVLNEAYAHYKTTIPTAKTHHTSTFTFWNSKAPGTAKSESPSEAPSTPHNDADAESQSNVFQNV